MTAHPDRFRPPDTDAGTMPNLRFSFAESHNRRELPVAIALAGVNMRLGPGAVRELHLHPNADEWQCHIAGRARMTVFAPAATAEHRPVVGRPTHDRKDRP